jgi:trimeric autotransporter adhesin
MPTFRKRDDSGPSFARLCRPAIILAALCLALSFMISPRGAASQQAQAVGQRYHTAVRLIYPNGLALNDRGDLYISDTGAHRVFKLNKQGRLTTVAGTGEGGFGGDGGPAVNARLFAPHDLAFDAAGNLLIADTLNHRVRRVDRGGVITTVAGNGKAAYAGDGGAALDASLNNPQGLALDREGSILVADTYNYVVRRVDRAGRVTTLAGTVPGFGGDGGPALKAQMSLPMAVAVAPDGSVYVSDAGNSRVRRIAPDGAGWKIQTVIGYGPGQDTYGAGFAGDGGPPEKAKIFSATDLEFNAAGDLFISDSGNNRVRVVRGGVMTTVAGTGQAGFAGDGGRATAAELNTPQKIAVAADGSIYIADRANRRVRKVDSRGVIRTIAGDGKPAGMLYAPEVGQ